MRLQVGDPVVIKNVRRCTHGWNDDMLLLEGEHSVITDVYSYSYRILADGGKWTWDDETLFLDTSAQHYTGAQYDADALFAEIMGG